MSKVSCVTDFSITFLGTGTSVGVPVIGCPCQVCCSENPRDQRFRSSVVLRAGEQTLLVDSGPDLRMQALREGLCAIDAILYTHCHLDHVAGFDELRAFCWRRDEPLPLHATAGCMAMLRKMYAWAFAEDHTMRGYVRPDPREIDGPFFYGSLKVTPVPVEHAWVETIGYLFEHPEMKRLAYLPDVKRIPASSLELLKDVDVFIVDALREAEHSTHFSLEEALAAAVAVGAKETWLTHLSHEYQVDEIEKSLPQGVKMAWDGLRISLNAFPSLA